MPRPNRGQAKQKPRPTKPIDWKVVDELLQSHCPGHEVAARLGVCFETLAERCEVEKGSGFSEYKAKLQADGKALIRHGQMKSALRGNTRMLIHLGEHILGQGKEEDKLPPHEDANATRHALMIAMAEIDRLKEQLNGNQPKAEQELRGSDAQV